MLIRSQKSTNILVDELARKDCLKKHIEHKHEGVEQKYECDECGKLFKTKEMKKDHIQLDHHKSLLECEEDGCDAVYLSRTGLRDHNKIGHSSRSSSIQRSKTT